MDITSHEVIWDHLKEFDMNGRISCGPLTVNNAEAGSWVIAPNPAASQLMVLREHFTSSTQFHIFNAAGVRCLEGTVASPRTTIGLQGLASGLYGIHLNGETRPFIVQ